MGFLKTSLFRCFVCFFCFGGVFATLAVAGLEFAVNQGDLEFAVILLSLSQVQGGVTVEGNMKKALGSDFG